MTWANWALKPVAAPAGLFSQDHFMGDNKENESNLGETHCLEIDRSHKIRRILYSQPQSFHVLFKMYHS